MVNHRNRKKTYPDQTLENAARAAGAAVRCMWQMPGPPKTWVVWLECLEINGVPCIVQTYKDGCGWNAFTPCVSNKIRDTVADVLNRCEVERYGSMGRGDTEGDAEAAMMPEFQ